MDTPLPHGDDDEEDSVEEEEDAEDIKNMVTVLAQAKMNTMKLMRKKELDIKRDLNS